MERESLRIQSGVELVVETRVGERQLELLLRLADQEPCVLHWGLRRPKERYWHLPPQPLWPPGTMAHKAYAARTPFSLKDGENQILLRLGLPENVSALEFALFFPQQHRWDNNGGRNYHLKISELVEEALSPVKPAGPALKAELGEQAVCFEQVFALKGRVELAAGVSKDVQGYHVLLLSNVPGPLRLHWGIARNSIYEWQMPPPELMPPGTRIWENTPQTPFTEQDGLNRLELRFEEASAPLGIQCVLKKGDTCNWLRDQGGKPFFIPIVAARPLNQPERPSGLPPEQTPPAIAAALLR